MKELDLNGFVGMSQNEMMEVDGGCLSTGPIIVPILIIIKILKSILQ